MSFFFRQNSNNKMNTKEKIEVMEAFESGKPIQISDRFSGGWGDWTSDLAPAWNWEDNDYRVKPEPETFWIIKFRDNSLMAFADQKRASEVFDKYKSRAIYLMRVKEG